MWFRLESHRRLPRQMPESVQSFCRLFRTREFRSWFTATHEAYFEVGKLKSRFPRSQFSMFLARALNYLFRNTFGTKLWNVYSSSVEFSFLPQGGAVPPHTDAFQKRLALVFYTPFNAVTETMRSSWGTEFWRARSGCQLERSWHTATKVGSDFESFAREHEVFLKVPYEANSVCGFVKSDQSWHSVSANPLPEHRIALVINVWDLTAID